MRYSCDPAREEGTRTPLRGDAQFSGSRRGAALLWLALACALLLVGGAVLLVSREGPPAEGIEPGPTGGPPGAAPEAPADPAPSLDAPPDDRPRTIGTIETRPAGLDGGLERVFEGTGTIVGQVSLPSGAVPPPWMVHLEPSRVAAGRESAEPRTYEAGPGEETFELRDVPMGAYRVYATAAGYRSRATELALYRLDGPGDPKVEQLFVTLTLRPLASVDGRVRGANGDPAEGLEVHLVPRESLGDGRWRDGEPLTATTDPGGVYRFDGVDAGAWQLRVGSVVRPLVPARPITVGNDRMELDEVTLPRLASIDVLVMDEAGRPFPDVELVGYLRGAGGGALRGRTDGFGHFTARHLPPGPWRVEATYPPEGFKARKDWLFEAVEQTQAFEVVIR